MNHQPQLVRRLEDPALGLHGFLVIDSSMGGRSCGGVRVSPDVSLDEVKALARAMTLKYAFLNDATIGGAKAGIVIPNRCTQEKKAALLRAFGRQLSPILKAGRYIPWTDLNTGEGDINLMRVAAGLPATRMPDSAHYTALSVLGAALGACRHKGLAPRGLRVAIEGLGRVGSCLAEELSGLGARIVAVSNHRGAAYDRAGFDVQSLLAARAACGDVFIEERPFSSRAIPLEALLELEADLLVPAARPWCIHHQNVSRVRAAIIAPAANCPLVDGVGPALARQGVLYVPDFVCNLGGVYGSRLEGRVRPRKIHSLFVDGYSRLVQDLLVLSDRKGRSPEEQARLIARQNRQRLLRREGSSGRIRRGLVRLGLRVLDSPHTPAWLQDRLLSHWARRDLSSKLPV